MHYCMSRRELSLLLRLKARGVQLDEDEPFRCLLESSENWENELGCLAYLFSMELEKESNRGGDCQQLIEVLYSLPELLYLFIQEFDSAFIDYMLGHIRNRVLPLEDDLVELQNGLGEHRYDQAIRH